MLVEEINRVYSEIFDINSPYDFQQTLFKSIFKGDFPILLKAPTGSGKTEAVIAPFLYQFVINDFFIAPRLIYVLPMRVLVNNVAERIRRYASRVSRHVDVKVHHGESPNAPFFMSDIVVTTLDQFLYAFARSSQQVKKHIDIPAGAIASSLIVFDEAHMYRDDMTFSIMRALIEILQVSRIPFLLMTATMPKTLEKSLFENENLFPQITVIKENVSLNNMLKIQLQDVPIFEKGSVNLTDEILEILEGKKTLVVLNQVEKAQAVYREIKDRLNLTEEDIVLLHSRFTLQDRRRHESKALSFFGERKQNTRNLKDRLKIVVSTQVLEAGMDFSAEILLTELAPADSLVQRAGRCARYRNEVGRMIVFPVESQEGQWPYEKQYLEVTKEWLDMNSDVDMKDFETMCSFVDILDYIANDFEASDTLFDLYECTLYADTRPQNIQLRKGKPITLVVINPSQGKGRKKKDKIKSIVESTDISMNSIQIDYKAGWGLMAKHKIDYELNYNRKTGKWEPRKTKEILPFKHYILEDSNYDPEFGVKANVSTVIL